MSGEWLERIIQEATRLRRGLGMIWLHRSHQNLLPTIRAALEQARFEDKMSGIAWLKRMPDGTERAIVLHLYDNSAQLKKFLACPRNVMIIVGGSESLVPTCVNRVVKSENDELRFSTPPGANELVMGCEYVCTVESRNFSSFNADQQNAIEMLKRNFILTGTKWIFFASTQHQPQLALLFDSISARFYPFIERRVVMYRCKKESPDNLPVLEPLSRLGLEAYLLLKVNSDDFVCYYIMVETLPYMIGMMYWGIYRPLSPWYLDCHNACWRFTKQMYDHPNNVHIKEQIGDLLALFTFRPYGGQPA